MTQRFDVELFIIHPSVEPTRIEDALGLKAKVVHRAGDRRRTPKGRLLQGTYADTRWRHSRHFEVSNQRFVDRIVELIDDLEPHKAFFRELRSTGGSACVVVQFLGDGYFGDKLPRDALKRLIDLELDFGVECYVEPQSKD